MKLRPKWRAALIEVLTREEDAHTVLLNVVRQLDLPEDVPPESVPAIALARCILAIGPAFAERYPSDHPVQKTLAACEAFVVDANEGTWHDYFTAATNSYPFGPGDGCHSSVAHRCERGTGCITGSGTLMSIAHELGEARTLTLIREHVLPWLQA